MTGKEAERAVAAELDRRRIPYAYEPQMFTLQTEGGRVTAGFTPDFYLPTHDIFIEVTLAKDLNRKNAKLRSLSLLHPQVRVFLVTRQDLLVPLKLRKRIAAILQGEGG